MSTLPTVPAAQTYAVRSKASGVVKTFGFNSDADFDKGIGDNQGAYGKAFGLYPISGTGQYGVANSAKYGISRDSTVYASGVSSMKFVIPSQSSSDMAGSWFTNFQPFGSGETFYVQWRQRFSKEYLTTYFNGGGGWKLAIIGEGDRPPLVASSCSAMELVVQNSNQFGVPQMYHSCGSYDGTYTPIHDPLPPYDYKEQNAMPSPYCLQSKLLNGDKTGCFPFYPDEWMTFQVRVQVGTWYQNDGNYHKDSRVSLWVARDGKPSQLVIDQIRDLTNGGNALAKYGKVWLLPYHTGKDPSQIHPTCYTWCDDLIVSTQVIADAVSESSFQPAPQPTPPTGGSMFVQDSLTDTDGKLITAHAGEVGATWTLLNGPASVGKIFGNRLVASPLNSDTSRYSASGTPPSADYDVSVDIIPHISQATAQAGVMGRIGDANNFYQADYYWPGGGAWRLYKMIAGTWTSLGSFPQVLTADQSYRLTLRMVSSSIKLMVDGVERISVTDTSLAAAGKAGVLIGRGSETDGFRIDNFAATDAGSPPTNVGPTVNAGADQTITLPATAQLQGTVADDGLPSGTLTRQWSGPAGVTFSDPTILNPIATFPAAGVYVLTLTASDGALQTSDTVQITVNPAAAPPPSSSVELKINGVTVYMRP